MTISRIIDLFNFLLEADEGIWEVSASSSLLLLPHPWTGTFLPLLLSISKATPSSDIQGTSFCKLAIFELMLILYFLSILLWAFR